MPFPRDDAASSLIDRALDAATGQACLGKARQRLLDDLRRDRFAAARAQHVFAAGIDAAVWDYVGQSPLRSIIYRNHLTGVERAEKSRQLAATFATETGAKETARVPLWLALFAGAPARG